MSKQYEKTKWVNEQTPLNAVNLNKIEQGISDAIETSNSNETKLDTLDSTVKDLQIDFVTKTQELEEELETLENKNLSHDNVIFNLNELINTNKTETEGKISTLEELVNSNESDIEGKISTLEELINTNEDDIEDKVSTLEELINTNEDDIEGKVSNIQSQIENIKKVLTSNDVDYDTLQELVNALKNNVTDIGSIFTELAKKADKTSVPTKVSQLENDEGYLKEHQFLEAYYTKTQIDSELTKINTKNTEQDTSIANALSKAEEALEKANQSGESVTPENVYTKEESDNKFQVKGDYALASNIPVIYEWAKSSTKPTYNASEIGLGNVTNEAQIPLSQKGSNSGVATLDANGKVPSSQLPSYVDDVLEYANRGSFPATGETGKIYINISDGKTYRWSGTTYSEISESLALGETSSTAYAGDKGKANAEAIAALQSSKANANEVYSISEIDSKIGDINTILDTLNGEVI